MSNHGNWFTSGNQNKEMKVLAQSYDWLLFLTDDGLAQFITDLLDFHNKWVSDEDVKNDIVCFTIREIKACIQSYIEEQKTNGFKIVRVIYGSRYEKEKKK